MINTPSLYHVQQDHQRLLSFIADMDGEVTEEIEQLLEINREQFEPVAVSLANVTRSMDDSITAIDAEIKRLTADKQAYKNRKEKIATMVKDAMVRMGISSITTPLLKLSIRRVAMSVQILSEADLPAEMMRTTTTVEPDKKKILERIKAGELVPGAKGVSDNTSLQIK